MPGIVGQLLIVIAFVACALSGLAYFLGSKEQADGSDWRRIGRAAWGVMTGASLGAAAILLYLLVTHQFQYGYVFQYSSRALPPSFLISSFWAGQEGSFLLWILFTAIIGVAVARTAREWENPVMTLIALSQLFLLSMIVGLKLGGFSLGSSPFASLADKFPDAPIFQQQPDFVPADGNGLNDLLQNYWMVIHPPMLFVGFASMMVPFAFAVAALWKRRYTEWVRPALPWALFATMILGFGIALGGYWAYVTLSFGGYWAWDPVENSSLVPWLVGVAAVHMMITQRRSGSSHKAALLLSVLAYVLVIYSTFLTRSGILGDISVHSFVDLGLYGQLVVWIGTITLLSVGLFIARYKELPVPERQTSMLSREFMIFSGAVLLCATAAVILLGTSAPIMGKLFRESPSAVPIAFYNKWTLPLAVIFTFLAGLGQLFWWHKMTIEKVNRVLLLPIGLSVVATVLVLVLTPFVERTVNVQATSFWSAYGTGILMLLLVFAAFFAFFGNGMVLFRVGRGNLKMAGGALAHLGMVLSVFGIVTSSGFDKPLAHVSEMNMGQGRSNFVLARGETRTEAGYTVTYRGREVNDQGRSAFVLDVKDQNGNAYTLKPVVYQNKQGQWIQNPDLKNYVEKDVYIAVSPNEMFGEQGNELALRRNDSTRVGDGRYTLHFIDFDAHNLPQQMMGGGMSDSSRIAVTAIVRVTDRQSGQTREIRPVYRVQGNGTQEFEPASIPEWNLTVAFTGMNVDTGEARLALEGVAAGPKDWIVIQGHEKPFINILWLGILMMTGGFGLAMTRRIQDRKAATARRKEAVLV